MTTMIFYLIASIFILGYIGYSWYWQAIIDVRGKYRYSSIVWSLIFIWIAFNWNYLSPSDTALPIFLALFITMSIIDGFAGLANKRIVLSGYFKRTLKYRDVEHITLINVSGRKHPLVMAIFRTQTKRVYYLPFSKQIEEIIQVLHQKINADVGIEIQDMI